MHGRERTPGKAPPGPGDIRLVPGPQRPLAARGTTPCHQGQRGVRHVHLPTRRPRPLSRRAHKDTAFSLPSGELPRSGEPSFAPPYGGAVGGHFSELRLLSCVLGPGSSSPCRAGSEKPWKRWRLGRGGRARKARYSLSLVPSHCLPGQCKLFSPFEPAAWCTQHETTAERIGRWRVRLGLSSSLRGSNSDMNSNEESNRWVK